MRKLFLFLIVNLVFILSSCTKEHDVVNTELGTLQSYTRSYGEKVDAPFVIFRFKAMLERALEITNDSTLMAIFADLTRVEYAVIEGQDNNVIMEMRPSKYRPQFTIYISDKYRQLSNNGAIFVVIHELYHIYRYNKGFSNNDEDHAFMVKSSMYREWVRKALGLSQHSFALDYLVYSGTYESPVYQRLSYEKKKTVNSFCKSYELPY